MCLQSKPSLLIVLFLLVFLKTIVDPAQFEICFLSLGKRFFHILIFQNTFSRKTIDISLLFSENLRLVNGTNRCSGRVEIRIPGSDEWGTVCDRTWDLKEVEIVCRQLGCGSAGSAPKGAHFGRGSGRIWMDDVNCEGTENSLEECRANTQGTNNCVHDQDASVICSGNLRWQSCDL